ncbi:MAG: Asp-tRNA(Asn)/Glu-tRNA(Gln) amidotransferase subunit GatC [Planctomycetota bacterium]
MAKITRDTVDHVATLSRLALSEDERALFQKQLSKIIDYFEVLNALDTADVEPLSHPLGLRSVLREDAVEPSASREEALSNAPKRTDEAYKVPVVVDQS